MNYKHYPEMVEFEQGLKKLEIELNDQQKQQFIDYYEMLVEKIR